MQPSPVRCEACRFPSDLCLCPVVPRLVAPCRFVVVRHMSEREKLTNTARWAALALPGTRVLDHGLPGIPLEEELLAGPGTYVLYPEQGPDRAAEGTARSFAVPGAAVTTRADADAHAVEAVPPLRAAPREPPRVVVVPDGTWSQARRMMQRIPALRRLPRLALAGPPPGLRLRRPHRGDGMSTLEAIAGALAALGAPDEAEKLLTLHAHAVERVLRLKGMWPPPPEAESTRRVSS